MALSDTHLIALREARSHREQAARARKLADLSSVETAAGLHAYADRLERQADTIEERVAACALRDGVANDDGRDDDRSGFAESADD